MEQAEKRTAGKLKVMVFSTRREMGKKAALDAAEALRGCLAENGAANVMFAAAPSQNEFLAALAAQPDIDWQRVEAFHMDEYIGLPADHPAGFGNFLDRHIWDTVRPGRVYHLRPQSGTAAAIERYDALLRAHPLDLVFMGVGENGHIAFNDPPVANFNEAAWVKEVELDEICRAQQVNDGCFATLADVPTHALTVTVPGLMAAHRLLCMVPGCRKAAAVRDMLEGPVATACPASVLRTHPGAALYLDADAALQLAPCGGKP